MKPLSIFIIFAAQTVLAAEKDFTPIFDGKSLESWQAVPPNTLSDWSVQNGVIRGKGSANRLAYLVWKEELTDFELRCDYRMRTKGNTGIEIRSRVDKTRKRPFEGYHADLGHVGIGRNILGAWDFHFGRRREHPCPRGTHLIIDENQKGTSRKIPGAVTLKDIKKRDWNSVRIIAKGNSFQFFINGKPASSFVDNAKAGQLKSGWIALQLHDRGMIVEFRNLRIKK